MSLSDRRIWRNGRMIPWADATVHVLAQSIQRGTLVFDVMPIYWVKRGPAILGLDEHCERFTILGAASVRDVGLGFRPFRTAGSDPERIHFLFTDAGAARVCLELPAQRLGLHGLGSCLRHFSPRAVELRFAAPEPWSIDADLYPPSSLLRISAGPAVRFVSY